jgi:hypothetical protein
MEVTHIIPNELYYTPLVAFFDNNTPFLRIFRVCFVILRYSGPCGTYLYYCYLRHVYQICLSDSNNLHRIVSFSFLTRAPYFNVSNFFFSLTKIYMGESTH